MTSATLARSGSAQVDTDDQAGPPGTPRWLRWSVLGAIVVVALAFDVDSMHQQLDALVAEVLEPARAG